MPLTNAFLIVVLMLMALLVFQILNNHYRAEMAARAKLRHISRRVVYTVRPMAAQVKSASSAKVRASFLSIGPAGADNLSYGIEYHLPSAINSGIAKCDGEKEKAAAADCQSCA